MAVGDKEQRSVRPKEREMDPRDLRTHRQVEKSLSAYPEFKPLTRKTNAYPKPLDQLGRRPRAHSTGVLKVSDSHSAFFIYRDGEILTDRAFYGYLFCNLSDAKLATLCEFHWHPSHKGLHCKVPCKTTDNYKERLLKGAPELNLKMAMKFNPADEKHRLELIKLFCKLCGIDIPGNEDDQGDLFK